MAFFVVFYLFLCFVVGLLGKDTSFGFWVNFIFSIFFTPIPPLIYILIASSNNNKKESAHSK